MDRKHSSRRSRRKRVLFAVLVVVPSTITAFAACKADEKNKSIGDDNISSSFDGGRGRDGAREASTGDAGDADAPVSAAAAVPDTPEVARGRYLVDHVAVCGSCHTPGGNTPDPRRYLSGVDCLIDTNGGDQGGCLNSSNLTNDSTGLKRRSNADIKRMFMDGKRPEGRPIHPYMPYWSFHNMTNADADAIVAYLRTVPAVNHIVGPNALTFTIREPAAPIDPASIPKAKGDPDGGAARGRYLAAMAGRCLECHTVDLPAGSIRPIDMTKPFGGNRAFSPKALGLQSPPLPETIYSANITPAPVSGIGFWTVADVKKALQEGTDNNNGVMCPPMPVGPMGGYGGLTDEDALDIATYIMSLPPIDKFTTGSKCVVQ